MAVGLTRCLVHLLPDLLSRCSPADLGQHVEAVITLRISRGVTSIRIIGIDGLHMDLYGAVSLSRQPETIADRPEFLNAILCRPELRFGCLKVKIDLPDDLVGVQRSHLPPALRGVNVSDR